MTVMYRFKLKGETGVGVCLHVKVFSLCTSTIKIALVQTIFVPVQRQFVPEFLNDNIKMHCISFNFSENPCFSCCCFIFSSPHNYKDHFNTLTLFQSTVQIHEFHVFITS